jgi:hypothetical protein
MTKNGTLVPEPIPDFLYVAPPGFEIEGSLVKTVLGKSCKPDQATPS